MRTFTLKLLTGSTFNLTDEDCSTIDEFKLKILESKSNEWGNTYSTVRIIYSGKILTADDEFFALADESMLVIMAIKAKKETTPTPIADASPAFSVAPSSSPEPAPVQAAANLPVTNPPETSGSSNTSSLDEEFKNTNCTYRQSHASTMVILKFVHDNPQLHDMFNNDIGSLINHFNGDQLKGVYKTMLEQSEAILSAADNGGTISVDISGDSSNVQNIELTTEDNNNIQHLAGMGFPVEQVVQLYVQSGKDVNVTLEQLLAFVGN